LINQSETWTFWRIWLWEAATKAFGYLNSAFSMAFLGMVALATNTLHSKQVA
jgi:hypothetical protein